MADQWDAVYVELRKKSFGLADHEACKAVILAALSTQQEEIERLRNVLDMIHSGAQEDGTPYEVWARNLAGLALNPPQSVFAEEALTPKG
jgi:hypothetical protein